MGDAISQYPHGMEVCSSSAGSGKATTSGSTDSRMDGKCFFNFTRNAPESLQIETSSFAKRQRRTQEGKLNLERKSELY